MQLTRNGVARLRTTVQGPRTLAGPRSRIWHLLSRASKIQAHSEASERDRRSTYDISSNLQQPPSPPSSFPAPPISQYPSLLPSSTSTSARSTVGHDCLLRGVCFAVSTCVLIAPSPAELNLMTSPRFLEHRPVPEDTRTRQG